MEPYKNLNDSSGVSHYEIGTDYILVKYKNADTYMYTYNVTGALNVEAMKKLAVNGKGLSTFISKHIKNNYADKWGE